MADQGRVRRTTGREVLAGGLLTGLATGFAWPSVVELLSMDGEFSGSEFLTSLPVPSLAAVLIWKLWRTGIIFGVLVAYLVLLIPLIGLGIGGANVLQSAFAGAIAGVVYGSPWAIWRGFRPATDPGEAVESTIPAPMTTRQTTTVEASGGDWSDEQMRSDT